MCEKIRLLDAAGAWESSFKIMSSLWLVLARTSVNHNNKVLVSITINKHDYYGQTWSNIVGNKEIFLYYSKPKIQSNIWKYIILVVTYYMEWNLLQIKLKKSFVENNCVCKHSQIHGFITWFPSKRSYANENDSFPALNNMQDTRILSITAYFA